MNILIFDDNITGHHLEYLHHIYQIACSSNNHFFFLINKDFEKEKEKCKWDKTSNVTFVYLTDSEQKQCEKGNLLLAAYYKSIIIRSYTKVLHIDKVFLITFILCMPFLPWLLNRDVGISGILYRIYLYESQNFKKRLINRIRFSFIVKSHNIERVFVLNDNQAVKELNQSYSTDIFNYLPDPIPSIDKTVLHNIRAEYSIPQEHKLFLHFGGMTDRKGTLEILDAISLMTCEELTNKTFVFAGRVYKSIREVFYEKVRKVSSKVRIIVIDGFCSYELINNLCYSCDCLLMPYKQVCQSSGVLGYAAFFNKPVIGPSEGLIGHIIQNDNLGETISQITPELLKRAICKEMPCVNISYTETHSLYSFINTIAKCWNI